MNIENPAENFPIKLYKFFYRIPIEIFFVPILYTIFIRFSTVIYYVNLVHSIGNF